MFEHTDQHTVRGRFTLHDGVVSEHIFQYGSFCKLKIAKESNDLAQVLLEPFAKSNELLMNRRCRERFTTDRDSNPVK